MRRVHKYDAMQALDSKDDESDYEVPSKRKGSDAPTSCRMKRTSSSQAKARAASASYSRDNHEAVDLGYPARRMSYPQSFDLGQQPLNFAHVFSSGTQQVPYDGAVSQMSYGFSYP